MKNALTAAALLVVLVVVAMWLAVPGKAPPSDPVAHPARPDSLTSGPRNASRATNAVAAPAVPGASVPEVAATGAETVSIPAETAGSTPEVVPPPAEEQVIEAVRLVIRTYGQRFRGNPVGNNAEITASLNGGNARGIRFLDGLEGRINARGELMDEWGTAYFFHQLSGTEMEIRSAGPDRAMWTTDDLVVR